MDQPTPITSINRLVTSLVSLVALATAVQGFGVPRNTHVIRQLHQNPISSSSSSTLPSSTQLGVFWFGGSNSEASVTSDEESCELVEVRIDRTSPNSRRIGGEITVPKPIDDVWAILTDYDNLATHVPNLVESRRINDSSSRTWNNVGGSNGEPGDGAYRCRLYQKGAQKIIGFQFGASVTMDMTEQIIAETSNDMEERKIFFKCVDSQFFSEFDGEWSVQGFIDPLTEEEVTTMKYVVDVRPKGPVPVAALEWRIREDVPTNLREVKRAAITVGSQGVMKMREAQRPQRTTKTALESVRGRGASMAAAASNSMKNNVKDLVDKASSTVETARSRRSSPKVKLAPVKVTWYDDETMAAYLE